MMWIWIAFIAFVLLMLALDLGIFHRKAHVVSVKEALAWSAVWLAMGLSFSVFVYFAYDGQWFGLGTMVDAVDGLTNGGATATEKYLTGYVVEKSLSVDNIFVFTLIFPYFAVPAAYQQDANMFMRQIRDASTSTACCSGASSALWSCEVR